MPLALKLDVSVSWNIFSDQSFLRNARNLLVPLQADNMGLTESEVGFVVALAMTKIVEFIALLWGFAGAPQTPRGVVEIVHGLAVRVDNLLRAQGASEIDPENLAYHQHVSGIVLAYQIVVLQPRGRSGHSP